MTYARGNKRIYSVPRNFPSRDFCAQPRTIDPDRFRIMERKYHACSAAFPVEEKKKRSVVGSEINFGAPYLANALKSVGEPVERVIQGGTAQPQYTVYIQRSSM